MSKTAMYLVRWIAWEGDSSAPFTESYSEQGSYADSTIGLRYLPVAVFDTEQQAKTDAHQREMAARAGVSPLWFDFYTLAELSQLDFHEAASRLLLKGIDSPPAQHPKDEGESTYHTEIAWRAWWDRESVNWSEQQLADAWAVFPKLRFFDVVEIEIED